MRPHFSPSTEMLEYWRKTGMDEQASQADIEALEAQVGGRSPEAYVRFITTYGSVDFCFHIPNWFDIGIMEGWQRSETGIVRTDTMTEGPKRHRQAISHIKTPKRTARYYGGTREYASVCMPSWLVPIGGDYGEGQILLEFGRPTERVFYWDADEHDWDGDGPTWIGFVAENFDLFLAGLRTDDSE